MIVHIDTSALIDSLTGPRRSLPRLTALVQEGHRIALSSLVCYGWRRGPRTTAELAAQEALLPLDAVVAFDGSAGALAADLHLAWRGRAVARSTSRPANAAGSTWRQQAASGVNSPPGGSCRFLPLEGRTGDAHTTRTVHDHPHTESLALPC